MAKGEVFCQIGQSRHEIAYVESGLLYCYALTPSGERVVIDFKFPGSVALGLTAAVRNEPAEFCYEAIGLSNLIVWPYALFVIAKARHPAWSPFETYMTAEVLSRKNTRYLNVETMSARERYAHLEKEFPPEWRAIPQHLVASYLRITPQHLSRLKRQS